MFSCEFYEIIKNIYFAKDLQTGASAANESKNLEIYAFFNGSGLDSEKEPHLYQVLNPFFAETHKPLNLVSSAADTLFVNEKYFSDSSLEEHDNDDDESKPASFSRSDGTDLNDLDAEDKQADDDAPRGIHQNVRQADKPPLRKKSKIVKPPHKKSEKIKSTTHGLSAIARGINASIAAQDKRFERQLKENTERERRLPEFPASKVEKDRHHEGRIAQLLISLKSSHLGPQYEQSKSMQAFSAWRGLNNVSQPNSVMSSHHSRQLSNVTSPAHADVWPGMTNISMVLSSCQSPDPYQPVNFD